MNEEETRIETASDQPDWKWQALFGQPERVERQWAIWLAAAQQAEQASDLRYWSSRSQHRAA